MRTGLLVAAGAVLGACSNAPSAPPPKAPTPPAACFVMVVKKRPDAPIDDVGRITVHAKNGCTLDLQPRVGATSAIACDKPGTRPRDAMTTAACAMGGDVVWPLGDADEVDATGEGVIVVGHLSRSDPKADLALVCAPYSALGVGSPDLLDVSQKARIRLEVLDRRVTSARWRVWLQTLRSSIPAATTELREAARAAGIDCQAEWLSAD